MPGEWNLIRYRLDVHVQAHALARVALHHAGVVAALVVVGHVVADGAAFISVNIAALAYSLFLHVGLGLWAAVVVDAVTDQGAADGAGSRCRGATGAAANLVAQQGAGDAANDGAA